MPVIVVGNLTAGGSGKTPMVIALARELSAQGYRIALICRGAGGKGAADPRRLVTAEEVDELGDEAVLLAEQTGLPVWVSCRRDRALMAAVDAGAEVIISDDGLQHQALPRSFEICMVDGDRGFGNGFLLPAGPLRQSLDRLETVDLLVTKGAVACRPDSLAWSLPLSGFRRLDGQEQRPSDGFQGRQAVILCAIANPDRFAEELRALGIAVDLHAFPDHYRFAASDLANLPGPLLVTAKDAVKLRGLGREADTWVVEQGLRLPDDVLRPVLDHLEAWPDGHSRSS